MKAYTPADRRALELAAEGTEEALLQALGILQWAADNSLVADLKQRHEELYAELLAILQWKYGIAGPEQRRESSQEVQK